MTVRVLHDSLGSVEVDASHLWGIHTARAMATLSFSGRTLGDLADLSAGLGSVKAAAARANGAAGVLAGPVAAAIESAASELAVGGHRDQLVVDPLGGGGAIGVHMNVNEVVATLANRALGPAAGREVDPRRDVGASQSTADVCHTAARLAVLDAAERLGSSVGRAIAGLQGAAARTGDAPTLARTCLQDALAVPARLLFDGAAGALARRRDAVAGSVAPLVEVVLGSTVVGTGAGATDAYRRRVVADLAELTGRPLVGATGPASTLQHGDDLVAVSAAVAQLAGVAAKLAQDLRLLGSGPSGGFGELVLPQVIEGSSFFTAKRNPAVPETVIAAALQVEGCDAIVRSAAARAELHLHVFDLAAAVAVLDALDMLARALDRLTDHVLAGVEVDVDRCAELAEAAAPHGDHR